MCDDVSLAASTGFRPGFVAVVSSRPGEPPHQFSLLKEVMGQFVDYADERKIEAFRKPQPQGPACGVAGCPLGCTSVPDHNARVGEQRERLAYHRVVVAVESSEERGSDLHVELVCSCEYGSRDGKAYFINRCRSIHFLDANRRLEDALGLERSEAAEERQRRAEGRT